MCVHVCVIRDYFTPTKVTLTSCDSHVIITCCSPANLSQKLDCKEVVANIGGTEGEISVWVPLARRGNADLAVLHHLIFPVTDAEHAHALRGDRLPDDLQGMRRSSC